MVLRTDDHGHTGAHESNGGPPVIATEAHSEETRSGSSLLELSNAVVRLYKEAFGRGPTKARAHFAGPDTLVVVLESCMTVAERNMAAMGAHERLRDARSLLQEALHHQLRSIVERALDRRTVTVISGIDTRHDVAVEVFTLAPESSEQ
jgi:uncharacterized protein YbcI